MSSHFPLLAVDSSSAQGSLALFKTSDSPTKAIVATWRRGRSHSEMITVTLTRALKRAGISLKDLRGLAVGLGPGSFTGIRVGINMVRALAQSFDLPVYSQNSLRLLAEPELDKGAPVVCLVNAFKNLVYLAKYQKISNQVVELIKPQAVRPDSLPNYVTENCFVVGDGWSAFADQWPQALGPLVTISTHVHPQAVSFYNCLPLEAERWENVKPLYIRASEAEEKLHQGLLKPVPRLFEFKKG